MSWSVALSADSATSKDADWLSSNDESLEVGTMTASVSPGISPSKEVELLHGT